MSGPHLPLSVTLMELPRLDLAPSCRDDRFVAPVLFLVVAEASVDRGVQRAAKRFAGALWVKENGVRVEGRFK